MIKLISKIFFFGLFLSLFSCDIIEAPFFESHNSEGETKENPAKVLIIDFTGHTCKSCPKAHRAIDQIKSLYGDQVVALAFHLGYFARTQNGDKFTTDFRTAEGSVLETYYEFVAFPIGLVNNLSKQSLTPYANWASQSAAIVNKQAELAISASTEFNTASSTATVIINLKDISHTGQDLKIAIYLTEDHIIDWQKDEDADPLDVENYEHNHVFRDAVASVWGEDISFESAGEEGIQMTRSLDLDDSWVPDNCNFVIFVYDSATMQIVQVEQVKVKE